MYVLAIGRELDVPDRFFEIEVVEHHTASEVHEEGTSVCVGVPK
jgi:hypothetical protein